MEWSDILSSSDSDLELIQALYSSSSSSDYEYDEFIIQAHTIIQAEADEAESSNRTREYCDRGREEGHARLWNDYFAECPVFGEALFRRRFRMRRPLFVRILKAVVRQDPYFLQKTDATKRIGLSPYQKITSVFRYLAYGSAADHSDEYCRVAETTTFESVRHFCKAVCLKFEWEYLRAPNRADVHRLLECNKARGFPGMLGSIDCMHWKWKNCLVAHQGAYKGHCHAPTIILEAIADQELWFWHAFFGVPGANNDLNVLDRSPIFKNILNGTSIPVRYTIGGNTYGMGYYLADGIYPDMSTIVKAVRQPIYEKEKRFTMLQEAARKDIERAFGVLQSRWAIVRGPSKLWDEETLGYIMKTCIIMHNMIIEDERGEQLPNIEYMSDPSFPVVTPSSLTGPSTNRTWAQSYHDLYSAGIHARLRNDLIDYNWLEMGATTSENDQATQ